MGLEPHQIFFFEKISKNKATRPNSNFNFKWAWQAQCLSHTLQILKNYLLFIDEQMILVSFFNILNQKLAICKRPISSFYSRLHVVRFGPFWTTCSLEWNNKIGLSPIANFWLRILKNDTNIICLPIKDTCLTKIWRVWLKTWFNLWMYIFRFWM